MSGINNIQAEGQIYDILAPEIVNDYVEKLGKTCINPNGYTKGSLILATDGSNVQRLYKTTSNISSNQVISEGGNVELKKLEDLFDDLEDTLNDEIDDIDTELGNVKQALSNEADARAELGAHNFFPLLLSDVKRWNTTGTWSGNAYTANGVTYTFTCDGDFITDITLSGSASAITSLKFLGSGIDYYPYLFKKGNYRFSGCPSLNNAVQLLFALRSPSGTQYADNGEGVDVTLSSDTYCNAYLYIANGTNVSGNHLKPLLKLASDPSTKFTPYAKTNRELTDGKAEKSDLASISITGTTNNTGATIAIGTYFYLNGQIVKAKTDISNNATLTLNTNYEAVSIGALNQLVSKTDVTWFYTKNYAFASNKNLRVYGTHAEQFFLVFGKGIGVNFMSIVSCQSGDDTSSINITNLGTGTITASAKSGNTLDLTLSTNYAKICVLSTYTFNLSTWS